MTDNYEGNAVQTFPETLPEAFSVDREGHGNKTMVRLHILLICFVLIGSLNLGLTAFGGNIFEKINDAVFGNQNKIFEKTIYVLIAIAALFLLFNRNTYLPFLGHTVMPTKGIMPHHMFNKEHITIDASGARYVIYWAANPGVDVADSPEDAYGSYENSGVVPVRYNGKATLFFECPKSYRVGLLIKHTLPKHIHYRLVYDDINISEVRTIQIKCQDS